MIDFFWSLPCFGTRWENSQVHELLRPNNYIFGLSDEVYFTERSIELVIVEILKNRILMLSNANAKVPSNELTTCLKWLTGGGREGEGGEQK